MEIPNNNNKNNNNKVLLKIAYALHARDQKQRSLDTSELYWKHESAEGIVLYVPNLSMEYEFIQ